MNVFDLFRGFFGVPGGHYRGEGRRDPFFDGMTHDDDEDDEDDEEDGIHYGGYQGAQQDPFDDAWRFGFSLGPNGVRLQEPEVFGQVFREMEEIVSQLGRWEGQPGAGHFGVLPNIQPPPPQDRPERGRGGGAGGSSGNSLRDFMLKSPGGPPSGPPRDPGNDGTPPSGAPHLPNTPFHRWTPFSKFSDIWRGGLQQGQEEQRGDRDLDSQVSSGGLDQILSSPAAQPPTQPKMRSFFQSVSVTKVVKPDGSVEERRTVRDGQGNEETTVTRSGGQGSLAGPQDQPGTLLPGGPRPFSDMHDEISMFSKFFGGPGR